MGVFYHPLEIGPSREGPFEALTALVDTGSTYTWMTGSALARRSIRPVEKRLFETADGRVLAREVDEAAVRADTRESFGLATDPVGRRLIPVRGHLGRTDEA